MTAQRMYLVTHFPTGQQYLRIAPTQAQALRHVVDAEYGVTVPNAIEVAQFVSHGLKPQPVTAPEAPKNVEPETASDGLSQ